MNVGPRLRTLIGIAAACVASIAALPAVAGAATSNYAPQPEARSFNGGAGGWTAQTTHSGVCVELVTCYAVTSSHQANGGPDGAGDGFIRSELTTILNALTSTNAVWTSDEFTYDGVGGRPAQSLRLRLDRRTDLGAILPVIADDATYAVQAVPVGGGAPVLLLDFVSMEGAEGAWRSDPVVAVDRNALEVGEAYRLRIVSRFVSGISVLGSGTVDYDNVALRARRTVSASALRKGVQGSTGPATLAGKRLKVRVGCPAAVRPGKCRLNVTALLKRKGGRATATRKVGVRGGRKKVTSLRIKPKHRSKLASRRKVWIKVNARADGKKVAVRKRVRLRRG